MKRLSFSFSALVIALLAAGASFAVAGPATRLVVVMPGQRLVPGTGVTGSPQPQRARQPFTVHVYAVDAAFSIDRSYVQPITVTTDEPLPTAGIEMAAAVSGTGAALTISGGTLRAAMDGGAFMSASVGPASGGEAVCAALETALSSISPTPSHCLFDAAESSYTLFSEPRPEFHKFIRAEPFLPTANEEVWNHPSFRFDVTNPIAGQLHLDALNCSTDPNDPCLVPPLWGPRDISGKPLRGRIPILIAVTDTEAPGPRTLQVVQHGSVTLPVLAPAYQVMPAPFEIQHIALRNSDASSGNLVRMIVSHIVDPASLAGHEGDFVVDDPNDALSPSHCASLTATAPAGAWTLGGAVIECPLAVPPVTTDASDLQLQVLPGISGILSAETGQGLAPPPEGAAFLIDEAPPVLLSVTPVDTNSDGAPDQMVFEFSEEIHFSAGHGISVSDSFMPPGSVVPPIASGSHLHPLMIEAGGFDPVIELLNPDGSSMIQGGSQAATAITLAVRDLGLRPAQAHFQAVWSERFRRYILTSGIEASSAGSYGEQSTVEIVPTGLPDDAAAALKLGAANGGIERAGRDADTPRIEDFMVLSFTGVNLLAGMTDSDVVVDGNRIIVTLNNQPGSGTGTPIYIWEDNGDLAFVTDRAPVPNFSRPSNNAGLPAGFSPLELLREPGSTVGPGLTWQRTSVVQSSVTLDASSSLAPLTPSGPLQASSFTWTQVSGPAVPLNPGAVVTFVPQVPGVYTFELVAQVQSSDSTPYNPYLLADGTLRRRLELTVTPGPPAQTVVLLPGQTLVQGAASADEAVAGDPVPHLAGDTFDVTAVVLDQHFFQVPYSGQLAEDGELVNGMISGPQVPEGGQAVFQAMDRVAHSAVVFTTSGGTLVHHPSDSIDIRPGAADHLAIVLPGQTLTPGTGVTGTPQPQSWRESFPVQVYAVDSFGNIDPSYQGRVVRPVLSFDAPPPGVIPPPQHVRAAVSEGGTGAATSLTDGSLRLSINGSQFHEVQLGSPQSGDEICEAIENAVNRPPTALLTWGTGLAFKCILESFSLRFTLFLEDGTPCRAAMCPARSITIDQLWGSAPELRLGQSDPPSVDPNDPLEWTAPGVDPPPLDSDLFTRGVAMFRMQAAWPSSIGQTQLITIDQGPGPSLPAASDPFDVIPSRLHVTAVRLRDTDGNGSFDLAIMRMTEPLDTQSFDQTPPAAFHLEKSGEPPAPGVSIAHQLTDEQGYPASDLIIDFSPGIPTTGLDGVRLLVSPEAAALTGLDTGTTLEPNAPLRLIDGAPPVIVSTDTIDADVDGRPEQVRLIFSEDIALSAARGVSLSGGAADPNGQSVPDGSMLRIEMGGQVRDVTLHSLDPNDPDIVGAGAIAASIQRAVRGADARPAFCNFTASFDSAFNRFVLRSGTAGAGSSVRVLTPASSGDASPALRLGVANGGIERAGIDSGHGVLRSDIFVLDQDGSSLLSPVSPISLPAAGNELLVDLVAEAAAAMPRFALRDALDQGSVIDLAPDSNLARAANNLGLAPDFHPWELITEASSSPGTGSSLQLTVTAGTFDLDATSSIYPLVAAGPQSPLELQWVQVDGPPVSFQRPNDPNTPATALEAGAAEILMQELVQPPGHPALNPYLEADGTLSRPLHLNVQAGPAARSIVLLPGETLAPGRLTHDEAVQGVARVATETVPYQVRVVVTDEFFNTREAPPGAMVRLVTSDPDDIEPGFQPYVDATATFVLEPSDAATRMIPEVDDEVLVLFEMGDVRRPYVVGSLWNATDAPPSSAQGARFVWDADPRAARWNLYRAALPGGLADLDGDGLPDAGYGECVLALDPDPTDTEFEDLQVPPPGSAFLYTGTMTLSAGGQLQEASLGRTSRGMERPNVFPCP